ncbi:MAG: Ig-like domain-containing protein [Clostridiales bacterium]|nr:Ig-like domain-containing protein [Clostridiales bacterium]
MAKKGSTSSSETTEEEIVFHIEEEMLFIEDGDSYQINLVKESGASISNLVTFSFESSDSSVATVDSGGNITAKGRGCAIITCTKGSCTDSVYINVVTRDYTGKSCDFTMLTASGDTRTYHLYKQNAHNYLKYDSYLAWHGCATCSLTTVLGAYNSNYADMLPSSVIDGPEKATVSSSDWKREHVTRSLKQQMPLSMYGINAILNNYGVSTEYVRSYKKKEAKADILSHLQTGNPVIFEVRQKSNITSEKSSRWTNSYHTMIFLGVLTNGKVLVCDSVDRNWSDNGERIKIVEIDDVMEYMYSCTSFNTSMYFDGAASDGGYIKVYE